MKILTEQCQKININELVRSAKKEILNLSLQGKINTEEQQLDVTTSPCHFGGKRFWFVCPRCKGRVGTLYKTPVSDELLCRNCHKLTYLKSRYNKML